MTPWSIAGGLCVGDTKGLYYVKPDIASMEVCGHFGQAFPITPGDLCEAILWSSGRRSPAMISVGKQPSHWSAFVVVETSRVADDVLRPPRLDYSEQLSYTLVGWLKV